MKYPKLHHDKKLSTKLTLFDIENIRILYSKGSSITELSELYHVHKSTITYWTNENYRKKKIKEKSNYNKIREENDPIFNERMHQYRREHHKRRRKEESIRNYHNTLRKENLQRYKNYNKKYRSLHKEEDTNRKRKYRKENKEKLRKLNLEWQKKNRKARSKYQTRLSRAKNFGGFRLFLKCTKQ